MSAVATATGGRNAAGRRLFTVAMVLTKDWRPDMGAAVPLTRLVAVFAMVVRSALAPGTIKVSNGKSKRLNRVIETSH